MNTISITNGLQKRIHELRQEFQQILGEAQIIIDNTGAYLVTESSVTEIDQLMNIPATQIQNSNAKIPNPKSQIPNPKSQIPNPKSQIPNPKSQIPNPKSQIPNY